MRERVGPLLVIVALAGAIGCNANLDGTSGHADPGSDPGGGGGSGGGSTGGTSGGAAPCGASALPADVQAIIGTRCQLCHRDPPLAGVPSALVTTDDFARPAKTNPAINLAQSTLMRVTTTNALRMPPAPAAPLTTAEIQTLQTWVGAGSPPATCAPGVDGGASSPDAAPDPFAAPATCTSGTNWTGGLRESPLMQPGEACVACHAKGEAPRLSFGGTVYPSAHEPSQCNGVNGTNSAAGAEVVVIDAAGMTFTAKVNAAGNFYASARTAMTPPLKAKVVFQGRERVMIAAVPNGDCNSCHTQKGMTTLTAPGALPAPGRIILP